MDLSAQIRAALESQSLPPPSQAWLASLVSSRRNPPPPLPSLVMTAKTRLLATDLTSPGLLDPAAVPGACFPRDAAGPEAREARLPRDVFVQVLDVEDLSRSRWEQVEELEAVERGEQTRGREIVRLPAAGAEDQDGEAGDAPPDQRPAPAQRGGAGRAVAGGGGAGGRNATHKLVLQDCKGHKMFALELKRVDRIGIGKTNIGEKMLLKSGTVVARGMVLLEPATCVVLGGKVEPWHKAWVEGRLARLRESVDANRRD